MSETSHPGRAQVLASIRRALGVTGAETLRRAAVAERLDRTPRGIIPAQSEDKIERMVQKLIASQASVARLATLGDVPQAVATYLRENNLPASLRCGADARLAALDWPATALEVSQGASDGTHLTALSHALAGVSETGTLVVHSGADNPTTLNFLPDYHLVVLRESDVQRDFESVWTLLRKKFGKDQMPRAVNMITGPSRSGDIEQTILLGAHGPRSLHVLLVAG